MEGMNIDIFFTIDICIISRPRILHFLLYYKGDQETEKDSCPGSSLSLSYLSSIGRSRWSEKEEERGRRKKALHLTPCNRHFSTPTQVFPFQRFLDEDSDKFTFSVFFLFSGQASGRLCDLGIIWLTNVWHVCKSDPEAFRKRQVEDTAGILAGKSSA